MNIFSLMGNPDTSFRLKKEWYDATVAERWSWIRSQDEKARQKSEETDFVPPPPDNDELDPGMDDQQESKEKQTEGFYEITPYFGGYYKEHVYEEWHAQRIKWRKKEKQFSSVQHTEIDSQTKRKMFGKIQEGKSVPIPLHYQWGMDRETLSIKDLPDDAKVSMLQDQDGICYVYVEGGKKGEYEFEVVIGKKKGGVDSYGHAGEVQHPSFFEQEWIDSGPPYVEIRSGRQAGIVKVR